MKTKKSKKNKPIYSLCFSDFERMAKYHNLKHSESSLNLAIRRFRKSEEWEMILTEIDERIFEILWEGSK